MCRLSRFWTPTPPLMILRKEWRRHLSEKFRWAWFGDFQFSKCFKFKIECNVFKDLPYLYFTKYAYLLLVAVVTTRSWQVHAADAGLRLSFPGHVSFLPVRTGPGAAAGPQQPPPGLPLQDLTQILTFHSSWLIHSAATYGCVCHCIYKYVNSKHHIGVIEVSQYITSIRKYIFYRFLYFQAFILFELQPIYSHINLNHRKWTSNSCFF